MHKIMLASCLMVVGAVAGAGEPPPPNIADREYHRQKEQDRVRLQQMKDAQPYVRLQMIPEAPLVIGGSKADGKGSEVWVEIGEPGSSGDAEAILISPPASGTPVSSEP